MCRLNSEKDSEKKFFFDLASPYKTYHLYVGTKEEKESWMETMKNAQVSFTGAQQKYHPPSAEMIQQGQSLYMVRRGRATNAPIPNSSKTEQQHFVTSRLKMMPDIMMVIANPLYQPILIKQLNSLLDPKTNISPQNIIEYWTLVKKRKQELEEF